MAFPHTSARPAKFSRYLPAILRGHSRQNRESCMMLDAAIKYALDGLAVFPCERKVPLTGPGGFKNASLDAARIAKWWGEKPDAQIGLPTGETNHLFVLDVDGTEGERAAEKLNLPATFTVSTRPGRFQYWFRQPDGARSKCTASVLGSQLDTRGDGGYVIAPPSIHHETGKPYRVVKDIPWATAPTELLEPRKAAAIDAPGADTIPQGRRHQTILSIAGALRARRLSPEMVLAQLRIANEKQCHPPLEDRELQKLAQYVGSKPRGIPKPAAARNERRSRVGIVPRHYSGACSLALESAHPARKINAVCWRSWQGEIARYLRRCGAHESRHALPRRCSCEVADTIFLSAEMMRRHDSPEARRGRRSRLPHSSREGRESNPCRRRYRRIRIQSGKRPRPAGRCRQKNPVRADACG